MKRLSFSAKVITFSLFKKILIFNWGMNNPSNFKFILDNYFCFRNRVVFCFFSFKFNPGEFLIREGFNIFEYFSFKNFYLVLFKNPGDFFIKLAVGENEMNQVYSIRENIYIQENGLNLKTGYNNYDFESFHFLVFKDGESVGTMRLIKIPDKDWSFQGLYFPPPNTFLHFSDLRNFLEISRFGFLKKHRGSRTDLLRLLYVAHLYADFQEYSGFCGIMRIQLFNYLERMGIVFYFIGQPFLCMNTWEMVPFASDVKTNIKIIKKLLN